MLYIEKIEGNVKGVGGAVELGPKTLIVGPSGGGKSRLVNLVELALTGRVSDLAGKAEVSRGADLATMAPAGEGELRAKATASDGTTFEWTLPIKGAGSAGKAHALGAGPSANLLGHAETLPLRDLRSALTSPDKARRFFLRAATGVVGPADIEARLPAALWEQFCATAGSRLETDPVRALLHVQAESRKWALEARKKEKTAQHVASGVAQGQAAPPTASQRDAAVNDMKAAQTQYAAATAYEAYASARAQQDAIEEQKATAQIQLDAFDAQIEEALRNIGTLNEALEALPAVPVPTDRHERANRAGALRLLADRIASTDAKVCGLCTSPLGPSWSEHHAAIVAATDALGKPDENAAKRAELGRLRTEWVSHHRGLVGQKQQVAHILAMAMRFELPNAVVDPGVTQEEAHRRFTAAQEHLNELNKREAGWEGARRARDLVLEAQEAKARWDQLETACKQAVAGLLDAAIVDFTAKVQTFLPEADRFGLRLRDGAREVCQFGFWRPKNGAAMQTELGETVLHTALSGAEWARCTAAIAGAMATGLDLQVIIPEERAYDPKTLADVMRGLTDVQAQVILTSPVKHAGRKPPGWTVITVGG